MNFICLNIIIPFFAFFCLLVLNRFIKKKYICLLGVLPVLISFILTLKFQYDFLNSHRIFYKYSYFNLINFYNLNIDIGIFLDQLSLTMLEIINGVGFLISVFSIWYFRKNRKYYLRYFIYINLFISSMSLLVLSNNLFTLYCGWELVGFCSYSLISFYNFNNSYVNSATNVFLITKIGDFCLLFGIFILHFVFNTLNIYNLNTDFLNYHIVSNNFVFLHLGLYLIALGACSKSAQFPFHKWLLLAMVGPSTVSALIHAATMITAGVYLIIRLHGFFYYFPDVLTFLSYIGAFTLVYSSFFATFEKNLKLILAYSTMSQLGYMFLGMKFNIWNFIIFHLVSHSFFKSLLFLSSGALINYNNNQKNIFKIVYINSKNFLFALYLFCFGGFALTAFPLFSSSFYTKGMILWTIFLKNDFFFFNIGLLGSLLTCLYFFRIFFIFLNNNLYNFKNFNFLYFFKKNIFYSYPLIILSFLSTFFGNLFIFSVREKKNLLFEFSNIDKIIFEFFISLLFFFAFLMSYLFFLKKIQFLLKFLELKKNSLSCFTIFLNFLSKFLFKNVYIFLKKIIFQINIFYSFYKKQFLFFLIYNVKNINDNYLIIEKNSLNSYILLFFLTFVFVTFYSLIII